MSVVVSIVAPAYNEKDNIEEFIKSVINQSFRFWELIIVDDCSTDTTTEIVKNYTKLDNRIKLYIRNELPKGAQKCRNIGIQKSTGKYIMVVDSDDVLAKDCLKQRVDFLDNNLLLDFAVFKGKSFKINYDDEKTIRMWGVNTNEDPLDRLLSANYMFGVWNVLFKREVLEENFFDEKLQIYQDFDLLVRILLKDYKYNFCEDSIIDYYYRQNVVGAITSNFISDNKYMSTIYLFDKVQALLQQSPKDIFYKKSFLKFFIVQLKRVYMQGTDAQKSDFGEFLIKYYPRERLKIYIIKNVLKHSQNNRFINFVFLVFYDRKSLFKIFISRFGNKYS